MKDIPGFPNYALTEDFQIFSKLSDRILKPRLNKDGYREVFLKPSKYKKKVRIGIHQIVCLVFYGERPEDKEVRHLDCNKFNNDPSNLTYGTKLENAQDSRKHSLLTKRSMSRLSDHTVKDIKVKLLNKETIYKLHKEYKVSRGCIRNIKRKLFKK